MKEAQQHVARQLLWQRGIEVLILGALAVTAWFGWQAILTLKQRVALQQQVLDTQPKLALSHLATQRLLAERQPDITRIKNYLLPPDRVGDFVSQLEQEAGRARVTVQIPDIKPVQLFDQDHKPLPPTGPTTDVRITLEAKGPASNLLNFLHGVEHVPYIVHLVSWELQATEVSVVNALPVPSGVPRPKTPEPLSQLKATLILMMFNTHETK